LPFHENRGFEDMFNDWIANILRILGYKVIREYDCGNGFIDIYLPKENIVIEGEWDLRWRSRIERCKEQLEKYASKVNAKEKWVVLVYPTHEEAKKRLKRLCNADKVLDSNDILNVLPCSRKHFQELIEEIRRLYNTKFVHLDEWIVEENGKKKETQQTLCIYA